MINTEEFSKICRICMNENESMKEIFKSEIDCIPICQMINFVTPIKLDDCELLPKQICSLCVDGLIKSYNFQQKSIQSDSKLRRILNDYHLSQQCFNTVVAAPAVVSITNNDSFDNWRPQFGISDFADTTLIKCEVQDYEHNITNYSIDSDSNYKNPINSQLNYENQYFERISAPILEQNHLKKSYDCTKCNIILNTIEEYENHVSCHHTNSLPQSGKIKKFGGFSCTICKMSFTTWELLAEHIKNHKVKHFYSDSKKNGEVATDILSSIVNKFKCTFCKEKFKIREHLIAHMNNHIKGDKKYDNLIESLEPQLKLPTIKEVNVDLHEGPGNQISIAAPPLKLFSCLFCPSAYTTNYKLIVHVKKKHKNKASTFIKYYCGRCDKKFIKHLDFIRHRKEHINISKNGGKTHINRTKSVGNYDQHSSIVSTSRFTGKLAESYDQKFSPTEASSRITRQTIESYDQKFSPAEANSRITRQTIENERQKSKTSKSKVIQSSERDENNLTISLCAKISSHSIENGEAVKPTTPNSRKTRTSTEIDEQKLLAISRITRQSTGINEFVAKNIENTPKDVKPSPIENVDLIAKRFKCGKCDKLFDKVWDMIKHKNTVHYTEHAEIKCNICNMYFWSKTALIRHNMKSHKRLQEKKYTCIYCGRKFLKHLEMQRHCKIHRKNKDPQLFTEQSEVKSAIVVNKMNANDQNRNDILFEYEEFDEFSSNQFQIKDPLAIYQCPECSTIISNAANLKRHIKNLHGISKKKKEEGFVDLIDIKIKKENELFKCTSSEIVSGTHMDLKPQKMKCQNKEIYLNSKGMQECPVCKKSFIKRRSLANHRRYCPRNRDKIFSDDAAVNLTPYEPKMDNANQMISTEKVHCPTCEKSFKSKKALSTHRRFCPPKAGNKLCINESRKDIFLNSKDMYECPTCKKCFIKKRSLSNHRRYCLTSQKIPGPKNELRKGNNDCTISEAIKCLICHKVFNAEKNAKIHFRLTHSKIIKQYEEKKTQYHICRCEICFRYFKGKKYLRVHLKRHKTI